MPQEPQPGKHRLAVDIPIPEAESLKALAKELSMDVTQTVRLAFRVLAWMNKIRKDGGRLVYHNPITGEAETLTFLF